MAFGFVRYMIAGSTKITPIKQPNIVTVIRSPKYKMGLKLENRRTENPATKVSDVKKIGIPEFTRAIRSLSSRGNVRFVFVKRIK